MLLTAGATDGSTKVVGGRKYGLGAAVVAEAMLLTLADGLGVG